MSENFEKLLAWSSLVLALVAFVLSIACVFSAEASEPKNEPWWFQTGKFAAGATVGFLNHEAGHIIMAELTNEDLDWHRDGYSYEWECAYPCEDLKLVSAGGFLAQSISSRVILSNERLDGRFWEGWVTFNAANTIFYIVRNEASNRRSGEGYLDLGNFSRKQQYWIEAALLIDVVATYKKWPVHWVGRRVVFYKEF